MEKNEINKTNKSLIPCFLCGNGCEIRYSIKKKPYFICEPCGIQVFIRRENGIKRFEKAIQGLNNSDIQILDNSFKPFEVISLVNRLAELQNKLQEIEEKRGIFDFISPNEGLEIAEKALNHEIKSIENKLLEIQKKQ